MLNNIFKNQFVLWGISLCLAILSGCNQNKTEQKKQIDVSEVPLQIQFDRFDKDLMTPDSMNAKSVAALKNKYGTFFTIFCRRISPIPITMTSDTAIANQLNYFKFDSDIKAINKSTDSLYANTDWLKDELQDVFKHRKHYFPKSITPHVITFISAFSYAAFTTDSVLGIGLDKYLGSDCPFYPALNYPNFMTKRLRKEYITANCIQALFQRDYDVNNVKNELLSQMIYYGKLIYYTDLLAPEMPDSIKLGYSEAQLKWCNDNEENIWTALIEQKMLYSTSPREYLKFVNDGPNTKGFPKEAPSRIGYYVGWQIVKAYMEMHPEVTLEQLCKEPDAQKILAESKYKPKK